MTTPAELVIPEGLRPRDGRFGCGPSKVRPEAVRALGERATDLLGTSHRQPAVKGLVERFQDGLTTLFDVPDGYEVLLANGGASAFWEMAVFGLVEQRSLHYVFGEFSSKFAGVAAAAPWLEDPVLVEADFGQRPALVAHDEADVQALTHNETSTGVMMEIERPDPEALVLVDATSGAGGLAVDLADVDVYYFSLQKGFAADGGLVAAIVSPAALERIGKIAASERYAPTFLDLQTVVDNSRKRQTYNTPAIATLFLAAEQIDWMNEQGGLSWAVESCAGKAAHVYAWAESRTWAGPFVPAPARSNVVATVDLDEAVSAGDVNAALRANGILDTESYRKLGRNQLRVGLFPAVDREDVEAYTACVDWVVERLGA